MKTKVILYDGQELDRDTYGYLYQFNSYNEVDIFTMYNSKLVLKYVGYIEFIMGDCIYELYCFPKEYDIVDNYETEFSSVITSIVKASNAESSVGYNDLNKFYASNLFYLNEIIKHYNQYGLLVEVEKEYKQSPTGKINWNKTIGKIVPKFDNDNFIYDKFVVEKKNTNITFLTKIIAKVLFEGTSKYSFYTPIIDTEVDYSDIVGIDNEVAINKLYELKNSTFKDYIHHVIDNLISYLSNDLVSSTKGVLVGTNNYNFVWEHIVAHGLGNSFKKDDRYPIGTYTKYNKTKGTVPQIALDHSNIEDRLIVDSKYYNDREEEYVDYKQLYYNYYMVHKKLEENNVITYNQVIEYNKTWINILIKPSSNDENKFSVFELDDGMRLYSLKINARVDCQVFIRYQTT